MLHAVPSADEFKRNWYTKFLKAMNEPTVTQLGAENREVYRFLWLRTFHRPIAIRLERHDDDRTLVVKELDGEGGYEPGRISKDVSRTVSIKEWDKFISLFEDARCWEMPPDTGLAADGALWLLEGYCNGKYHATSRHCPRANGSDAAFCGVCLYLLACSEIEVYPSEIY